MDNTFYAANAFQTISISFNYFNNTGKDVDLDKTWDEYELVESLTNEGALCYNDGNIIQLRTCIINGKEFYDDIEVTKCLTDVKANEDGLATFNIKIPVADVIVEQREDYATCDYGDACDVYINSTIYNEVVDNYMTDDSIKIDKVQKVFNDYFGKYLVMNNFKVTVIPFTEDELDDLREDYYEEETD